jgi:DNA-binding NarL/FixJ family response regulator
MSPSKQKSVFIADDSALILERLYERLSEISNIRVIGHANTAYEAIEFIQQLKPDIIILDIRMPRGNGIDVLKRLKKYSGLPIVIMFTNYPYPQYKEKCFELGADYFLEKSSEFEKIVELIQKLADGEKK